MRASRQERLYGAAHGGDCRARQQGGRGPTHPLTRRGFACDRESGNCMSRARLTRQATDGWALTSATPHSASAVYMRRDSARAFWAHTNATPHSALAVHIRRDSAQAFWALTSATPRSASAVHIAAAARGQFLGAHQRHATQRIGGAHQHHRRAGDLWAHAAPRTAARGSRTRRGTATRCAIGRTLAPHHAAIGCTTTRWRRASVQHDRRRRFGAAARWLRRWAPTGAAQQRAAGIQRERQSASRGLGAVWAAPQPTAASKVAVRAKAPRTL